MTKHEALNALRSQYALLAVKHAVAKHGDHDQTSHNPGGGGGSSSSPERQVAAASAGRAEAGDLQSQGENALEKARSNARGTQGDEARIQGANIDNAKDAIDNAKSAAVQFIRAGDAARDEDGEKAASHMENGREFLGKAEESLGKIK